MFKLITVVMLAAAHPLFAAEPVRVFAAAGTAPAMKEIAAEFTEETGIQVVFNFANAGTLARQILAGAPFDVFFSANEKWMNCVEAEGATDPETRTVLLKDEMVVIVPKGRSISVDVTRPFGGQTFDGNFALGDQSTPLGIYAKQALTRLGWWEPLQSHLCVGDTVNKALNYVVLDEADAGIVFSSVASCAADRVDIVAVIPAELHRPIRFPIAAAAGAPPEAGRFLEAVRGESACRIFEQYGWTICIPLMKN